MLRHSPKTRLQNLYRQKAFIQRLFYPDQPLAIADSYINLAIIEQKELREKEDALKNQAQNDEQNQSPDETMRHTMLCSYEDIHATKKAIAVTDIFKNNNTRLFIQGRAGIGKSTLCQYIAYQWAEGKLWNDKFDYIFWIALRNINGQCYPEGARYTYLDVLNQECFSAPGYELTDDEQQQLQEKIQINPQKILWLFDGLDEFAIQQNPHLQPLWKSLSSTSHLIITSRPNHSLNITMSEQLEVTGFTDENINAYIECFFNNLPTPQPDTIPQITAFLNNNPGIKGTAHIPINLELICSIWSMQPLETNQPLTMTALYEKMLQGLLKRYCQKQNQPINHLTETQLFQHCQTELTALSHLAYLGMQKNTIILSNAELQQSITTVVVEGSDELREKLTKELNDKLMEIGLLKTTNQQDYYFLHLTFQEFLAAFHLANQWRTCYQRATTEREQLTSFIAQEKYNPRQQVMWWFMAGLLKNQFSITSSITEPTNSPALTAFFHQLQQPPRDILGVYEIGLWLRCLDEGELQVEPTLSREILTQLVKWLNYYIEKTFKYNFKQRRSLTSLICMSSRIKFHPIFCDYWAGKKSFEIGIQVIAEAQWDIPAGRGFLVRALQDGGYGIIGKAVGILITLDWIDEKITNGLVTALNTGYSKETIIRTLIKLCSNNEWIVNPLMQILKNSNKQIKISVVQILGELGRTDNEVVGALIAVLKDGNADVRREAVNVLGRLRQADDGVVSALVTALKDKHSDVRRKAAKVLGVLDRADNKIVRALVEALRDRYLDVVVEAAKALGQLNRAEEWIVSALMEALRWYSEVESAVAQALSQLSQTDENAVSNVLNKVLRYNNMRVRIVAAQVLGQLGRTDDMVISTLMRALKDDNKLVKIKAARILGKLNRTNNGVVSALAIALRDENSEVGNAAAKALSRLSQSESDYVALPALIEALKDVDSGIRSTIAEALGRSGRADVVCALERALQDGSSLVRRNAANALKVLGRTDDLVINALITALEDEYDFVVRAAFSALDKLDQKANKVVNALVKVLKDGKNSNVREEAAEALGHLGRTDDMIVDALVEALKDENSEVSYSIAFALVKLDQANGMKDEKPWYKVDNRVIDAFLIRAQRDKNRMQQYNKKYGIDYEHFFKLKHLLRDRADAKVVARALAKFLKDNREWVKTCVAQILGQRLGDLGWANDEEINAEVVNALVKALKDKYEDVVIAAAFALGKSGLADDAVVSALVKVLLDEKASVREAAVEALSELGQADNKVVGALVKVLLEDEVSSVRDRAAKALGKLGQADDMVVGALIKVLLGGHAHNLMCKEGTPHIGWRARKNAAAVLNKLPLAKILAFMFKSDNGIRKKDLVQQCLRALLETQTTAFIYFGQNTLEFQQNNRQQSWQIPADQKTKFFHLWDEAIKKLGVPATYHPLAETPLHTAVRTKLLSEVRRLLAQGADINDQHNEERLTPLMLAIQTGDMPIVKMLVENHADINRVNVKFNSTIYLAAARQTPDFAVISLLIKHRQKLNIEQLDMILLPCLNKYSGVLTDSECNNDLIEYALNFLLGDTNLEKKRQANRKIYLAHLNSFGNNEHQDTLEGLDEQTFLSLRIAHYIELLCQLHQDILTAQQLPVSRYELITALKKEILIACETVKAKQDTQLALMAKRPDQNTLRECQVENIITKLVRLSENEEYIYQVQYQDISLFGHCFYVAFQRYNNNILIRIDNLWGPDVEKYNHPKKDKSRNTDLLKVKPFLVGAFSIKNFSAQIPVRRYIENLIILMQSRESFSSANVLPVLYIHIGSQNLPKLPDWPAKRIQIVGNCVVRNYSFGAHNRLGKTVYQFLMMKENQLLADKQRIEQAHLITVQPSGAILHDNLSPNDNPQLTLSSTTTTFANIQRTTSPQFFSPITSILPTHQELMKKLAQDLQIDYSEGYSGIAVGQALVNLAGIKTEQTGAQYCRNENGSTRLHLKFSSEQEYQQWLDYYNQHHTHFILQNQPLNQGTSIIDVDTNYLYHTLSINLAECNQSNLEQSQTTQQQSTSRNRCVIS